MHPSKTEYALENMPFISAGYAARPPAQRLLVNAFVAETNATRAQARQPKPAGICQEPRRTRAIVIVRVIYET